MNILNTFQEKLPQKLKTFISLYGWHPLICLPFYPIIVFISTPFRLAKTLWNCRILLNAQWRNYLSLSSMGINFLFCWTHALNFERYGRHGLSPCLGGGRFPLSQSFYHALLPLYLLWGLGLTGVLCSLFFWTIFHFLWINLLNFGWVFIVVFLSVISTTFYVDGLVKQKYHAFGWAFFPLVLYGLISEKLIIAIIGALLVSFGSTSIVALVFIPHIMLFLYTQDSSYLLALFPVSLKLISHFYWLLREKKDYGELILAIVKGLGFTQSRVKNIYKRNKRMCIGDIYYLFFSGGYIVGLWYLEDSKLLYLAVSMPVLLLINRFFRFADAQNIHLFLLSMATSITLASQSIFMLVLHWFLVAPPLFLTGGVPYRPLNRDEFINVPVLRPFNVKILLDGMRIFLQVVKSGEKVLFAFKRPTSRHNIFDGYRVLLEIPLYVASEKEICLFPDWYMIRNNNTENAIEFWGREIEQVIENCAKFHANYVIVYTNEQEMLGIEWQEAGFTIVEKLQWRDYRSAIGEANFFRNGCPIWWLLKTPYTIHR